MSYLPARLGWLAACIAFAACASAPEPRNSDDSAETPKRKKKKKKRKTVAEREAEERAAEKVREHQEERRRIAEGGGTPFKVTKPAKAEKPEKPEESEEPVKPAKAEPEPEPEASDEVTIIEDTEDEAEPTKPKSKAKTKAKPKPAPKKKKEPEPEIADEEPAPRKNRELAEDSEEEPENGESDEVAAKPKKKTAVVAAKAKRKPKAEEVPEIEIDSEPEPEPEPVRKKAKAKAREPEPADEGDVIDMEIEEDDPLKERRVAAIPVPGVDDDSESDEAEPEPLPPGTWPPQINDRPLTLAKDKLAVHGGLRVAKLTLETMPGVKTSSTSESFVLGGTYGLSDKLEIGFDYALGISPGTIKGPFTLHGAYRAKVTPKLELAVAAGFAVDFAEVTNSVTMTTATTTSYSFMLGAWARYRINRKASVFTGVPATPASPVGLSKLAFALPPLPYQVAVGLDSGASTAIDVPLGLGYQIKPDIYAFGTLNLAHIRVRNTENAFLFADFFPLALGAFYTRKAFDVGVLFSDDVKQGTDYLRLDLLLRYAIK